MNNKVRILFSLMLFSTACFADKPTKIIVFEAYSQDNALNPNLVVAQRYSGSCFTRSLANPNRTDAWRCQASNMVLDPCFEDGNSLACVVSPWTTKAAILELNQPLFKREYKKVNTQTAQPWAFELVTGQRCTFLTGASAVIEKERINYTCDGVYGVIGDIDRTTPVWKVDLYNFNTKVKSVVIVDTAWF